MVTSVIRNRTKYNDARGLNFGFFLVCWLVGFGWLVGVGFGLVGNICS